VSCSVEVGQFPIRDHPGRASSHFEGSRTSPRARRQGHRGAQRRELTRHFGPREQEGSFLRGVEASARSHRPRRRKLARWSNECNKRGPDIRPGSGGASSRKKRERTFSPGSMCGPRRALRALARLPSNVEHTNRSELRGSSEDRVGEGRFLRRQHPATEQLAKLLHGGLERIGNLPPEKLRIWRWARARICASRLVRMRAGAAGFEMKSAEALCEAGFRRYVGGCPRRFRERARVSFAVVRWRTSKSADRLVDPIGSGGLPSERDSSRGASKVVGRVGFARKAFFEWLFFRASWRVAPAGRRFPPAEEGKARHRLEAAASAVGAMHPRAGFSRGVGAPRPARGGYLILSATRGGGPPGGTGRGRAAILRGRRQRTWAASPTSERILRDGLSSARRPSEGLHEKGGGRRDLGRDRPEISAGAGRARAALQRTDPPELPAGAEASTRGWAWIGGRRKVVAASPAACAPAGSSRRPAGAVSHGCAARRWGGRQGTAEAAAVRPGKLPPPPPRRGAAIGSFF